LRPVEWVITHGRLAAVAALFFLGIAWRRSGWAPLTAGKTLLNLVFNIGLPLLVVGALGGVELERQHALLPATAVGTVLLCWAAAALAARRFALPKRSEGAMALAAMSINVSMVYPFAALSFSPAEFSQLVMFDMGHAVCVWTLGTVVACSYGGHRGDIPVLLKRVLGSPALWVLVSIFGLKIAQVRLPEDPLRVSLSIGQAFVLLVPLAMGLLVSGRAMRRPEVMTAVALRSGLGGLAGFGLATLFGLSGTALSIATIAAAAPVGFSAVVLSGREDLDLEIAASAAAISVFFGSIWIPFAVAFV
jgi:predicted permease